MNKLDNIFARAIAALEADNLEEAKAALAAALELGVDDDDPRVRYLEFMTAWLDEDTEDDEIDALLGDLGDLPERAAALADPAVAGRIVLDLSDILVEIGEVDDAEIALRTLGERDDLELQTATEALIMRAHVAMEFHEDIDEALALLDAVDPSMRERLGYVSLRAAVLMDLQRSDDAIALLREALAREDETELHYQLGVILRIHGEPDALEHLLLVRKRDLASNEVVLGSSVPRDEAEDLQRYAEDVLDTLPEPVMARLASAAIRVERWVSEDAIRGGADPRAGLTFEGRPSSDEGDDGEVEAIVLYRDAIVAQIDSDEDIISILALCLVEEVDRFFDLELFPGD